MLTLPNNSLFVLANRIVPTVTLSRPDCLNQYLRIPNRHTYALLPVQFTPQRKATNSNTQRTP